MEYIRSKYTHLLKKHEEYFLYSNISGAVAKITEKEKVEFLTNHKECTDAGFEKVFNLEEIQFIKDSLFYMEQNVDEDKLFAERVQEFKNKKELDVILALTEDCNFRCIYCFENHVKKSMSISTIDSIINYIDNYIRNNKVEYLRIAFYGGEPLLNFEGLQYVYDRVIKQFPKLKKDFMVITNGYLLNEKAIDILQKCENMVVQVTIDGNEEIHNKRRFLINGQGTYKKVITNAQKCSKTIPTIIRINIDKDSCEQLNDFLNDLENYEFEKENLYLAPNYVTANTSVNKEYNCHCFDVEMESFIVMEKFAKEAVRRGFKLDRATKKETTFPLGEATFLYCPAYAGRHWVFTPDGDIFACLERISFKEERIGNIYEQHRYNDNEKMWRNYSIAENEKCRKCAISAFCGGECGSKALNNYGKLQPMCGRKKSKIREEDIIF